MIPLRSSYDNLDIGLYITSLQHIDLKIQVNEDITAILSALSRIKYLLTLKLRIILRCKFVRSIEMLIFIDPLRRYYTDEYLMGLENIAKNAEFLQMLYIYPFSSWTNTSEIHYFKSKLKTLKAVAISPCVSIQYIENPYVSFLSLCPTRLRKVLTTSLPFTRFSKRIRSLLR